MSTAARKARKRAGIKFSKPAKTGTPLTERAWYNAIVPGAHSTKHAGKSIPRSDKRREKALKVRIATSS